MESKKKNFFFLWGTIGYGSWAVRMMSFGWSMCASSCLPLEFDKFWLHFFFFIIVYWIKIFFIGYWAVEQWFIELVSADFCVPKLLSVLLCLGMVIHAAGPLKESHRVDIQVVAQWRMKILQGLRSTVEWSNSNADLTRSLSSWVASELQMKEGKNEFLWTAASSLVWWCLGEEKMLSGWSCQ